MGEREAVQALELLLRRRHPGKEFDVFPVRGSDRPEPREERPAEPERGDEQEGAS